jgi:hypothetical protein
MAPTAIGMGTKSSSWWIGFDIQTFWASKVLLTVVHVLGFGKTKGQEHNYERLHT